LFRVRIKQCKKVKAGTRAIEISGTTHCCQKLKFQVGGGDKYNVWVACHGLNSEFTNM
jgi:hypothetical protein